MAKVIYEDHRPRPSGCGKRGWDPKAPMNAVIKDAIAYGHGMMKALHIPVTDMMRGAPRIGSSKTATEASLEAFKPLKLEPKVEKDQLDHPNYYTETGIPSGIEAWDHYELAMTPEEFQGAMKNNLYKYIFRAGHKGSETAIKDLKKAINYLKRWISYLEGNRIVWMRGTKNDSKV